MRGIYILVIGALALAGCKRDQGGESAVSTPLGVHVNVAPQTRGVVTGSAFSNGSSINIILHDAGATSMYQGVSQPYIFSKANDADPGKWSPTLTDGLIVGDLADVYAHYPAELPVGEAALTADKLHLEATLPDSRDFGALSGSDHESFNMKLRPTDPDATEIFTCHSETDLMTGLGTQVSAEASINGVTTINMKHALAMVIVCVKKSPHLTEDPAVSEITIQNSGANTPLVQGSFALADNAFTPNATPAKYTRTMSGFPIDTHYAMLVYPATMAASEVEILLVANNITYTLSMPAKTWDSGKVYIYNVEISANEAQIGSVTLADWPEWIDRPFDLE